VEDWKYDIFISYNRNDESFVEFLKRCLELGGLRCFRDTTGLGVYDKLDAALKLAISRSRWLMAVISPAYLQSYWCLFEALEAIQGQDVSLRFLPIVLRYSLDDQVLDETFVLNALREIGEQMRIFQSQMIAEGAFGLSSKLDKLAFVQNQLPKIFPLIGERLYPRFDLWDETIVRSKTRDLLAYVAPNTVVDVNAIKFELGPHKSTPSVMPRLNSLPVVVWKAEIGCQAWKNNTILVGNDVLVVSSGRVWNEPDEMDGIHCLHAETGKPRWFVRTPADANRLMVSKGLALAGCDDGSVIAVRQVDGVQVWSMKLDSAVVGGPLRLPANSGLGLASGEHDPTEPILVVTYQGNIYILDQVSGRQIRKISLGISVSVIAAPLLLADSRTIVVPTEDGRIHFVEYSDLWIGFGDVHTLAIKGHDLDENPETATAYVGIVAQPCLADNLILQGIIRDSYYDDPPLIAVAARTRRLQWVARATPDMGSFGNLRSPPVIVGRDAIFATPYSSCLCAVSLETGQTTWSVDLGQKLFEQWSGPVASGRSIFIGRHDGYLHKVSAERRRREWSLFLGEHSRAGSVVTGAQAAPEFSDTMAWAAGGSSPILSTPAIDHGRLYVGTHQGWLYCISNLGGDEPDF